MSPIVMMAAFIFAGALLLCSFIAASVMRRHRAPAPPSMPEDILSAHDAPQPEQPESWGRIFGEVRSLVHAGASPGARDLDELLERARWLDRDRFETELLPYATAVLDAHPGREPAEPGQAQTLEQELIGRPARPWDEVAEDMRSLLEQMVELDELGIPHPELRPRCIEIRRDAGARHLVCPERVEVQTAPRESQWVPVHMPEMPPDLEYKLVYVAPEIITGAEDTSKAAIYSLGLIALEMLLGRPVLETHSDIRLIDAHLTGDLGIPWDALPADARRWLERAVSRAPSARFETLERALRALAHE